MHFLRKSETSSTYLGARRACVTVKLGKNAALVIQEGSIGVAMSDSQWARLPDRVKVAGPDGERVKPSEGKFFWVSVESFDPFHLLLEGDEHHPVPNTS